MSSPGAHVSGERNARVEKAPRLQEVDALRGAAAVLVMLFHYTTRYDQLFVHTSAPLVTVPWGHLGVNLFFMISGFVIFMTLANTRHPTDFIVSRFSRLYPVYWVAVGLTFVTIHLVGLPGKSVDVGAALLNVFMFHNLFGIRNVDSVYWTLEVELLFYAAMLGLWSLGLLKRLHLVVLGWLALRVAYLLAARWAGVDLPYIVERFLILQFVPYFIVGMIVYNIWRNDRRARPADVAAVLAALGTIILGEGWSYGAVTVALGTTLYLAVMRRPALLRARAFLWLGAISYPLYLVHENIGWATILLLEERGVTTNVAIIAAIVTALAIAGLLHRYVEMPAMESIRTRYRAGIGRQFTRKWSGISWGLSVAGIVATIAVCSFFIRLPTSHTPLGLDNVARITTADRLTPVDCGVSGVTSPLIFLALGQSNAANSAPAVAGNRPTRVFHHGLCYWTGDPLPGATGRGSSIWTQLASDVETGRPARPVVLAVLAVDSTEIAAWTRPGPLRDELERKLSDLAARNLKPAAVLWQQGESDAQIGTTAEEYSARFSDLLSLIRRHGIEAPVLVAQSSFCRGDGRGVISRAQHRIARSIPGVLAGPDTDALQGAYRSDDCHFNVPGRLEAAGRWHDSLRDHAILASQRVD